ncbi:MAG: ATP-grasp domain-containing protein [Planctomycetaceae bacterium]
MPLTLNSSHKVDCVRVTCIEYLHALPHIFRSASDSMRLEAAAMFGAVFEDFLTLREVLSSRSSTIRLTGVLGHGLPAPETIGPHASSSECWEFTTDVNDLDQFIVRSAARGDSILIIAPESQGTLCRLIQLVEENAVNNDQLIGVPSKWIRVFSDKMDCHQWLSDRSIPSIPTSTMVYDQKQLFPGTVVIKPRDGVGSDRVFCGTYNDCLARVQHSNGAAGTRPFNGSEWIIQPFISGKSYSIGFLGSGVAGKSIALPPTEQFVHLDDGLLAYKGGRIGICEVASEADRSRILKLQSLLQPNLPAFRGYLGVDIVVPEDANLGALAVEINPRLCTSYVGYRQFLKGNLAAQMLALGDLTIDINEQTSRSVRFDVSGNFVLDP